MKDFDLWNNNKKTLEIRDTSKIICKKRQIWLCKIGENIGNEISKNKPFLRPVIIINSFIGGDLILIFPLTKKFNENFKKFLYKIEKTKGLNYDSYVLLNQIKTISKKRLIKRIINDIGENAYQNIIKSFKENMKI